MTTGNFYYQDSLGNTSHVTDAAGNLLERYTYSAFGTPTFYYRNAAGTEITSAASNFGIKHLFQGQLWTQETGLNDYRNCVELPAMGVFLQPDPIGFKGDAANIYRFCGNDPVDRVDPMGLVAEKTFGPLTSFDGGDWVRGSDGLTASDWDHKHDQAGMDGGAGPSGGASAGNGSGKSISAAKGGLMPLPPDLVSRMYATQQENAEAANNKDNWTPIGMGKRQQEEYSTTIYRQGSSLEQIGPKKGYHANGPKSDIYPLYSKGGGLRVAGTHVHVTGNGRHYGFDIDRARENHYISGVGSAFTPNIMNIYVPPRAGQGPGAYFHTFDGVKLIPGEVP